MAAESSIVRSKTRKSTRAVEQVPEPHLASVPPLRTSRTEMPHWLREDMIRQAAYFRAEARGFTPGRENEDWLAAEREVDLLIRNRYP